MRASPSGARRCCGWGRVPPPVAVGVAVAHAFALTACGDVPVRTTEVESALPRQASAIVVGQTNRAQARGQLGEPWLASDYWRFDLFRMSGKNIDVGIVLVPWPVPFGVSSEEVRAYVLVGYDANGVVSAVDSGATHGEDSSWKVPAGGGDSILLAAGAIGFAVESSSHTPSVLVSAARRDQYLATLRAGGSCVVLVGCSQDQCSNALEVDSGEPRPMPGVLTRIQGNASGGIDVLMQSWLAPLALRPGPHRLQVPPMRTPRSRRRRSSVVVPVTWCMRSSGSSPATSARRGAIGRRRNRDRSACRSRCLRGSATFRC